MVERHTEVLLTLVLLQFLLPILLLIPIQACSYYKRVPLHHDAIVNSDV